MKLLRDINSLIPTKSWNTVSSYVNSDMSDNKKSPLKKKKTISDIDNFDYAELEKYCSNLIRD